VSQRDVLLIADAGEEDGLGHISRSSAVAVALRSRGLAVDCLGYGAAQPVGRDGISWRPLVDVSEAEELLGRYAVVVLDSYRLPTSVADAVVDQSRLVQFHDVGHSTPRAALVITTQDADSPAPGVLAGPRYACLGPSFWGLPRREVGAAIERVLIATGGGDPGGAAPTLASAAVTAAPDATVELVRGPQSQLDAPPGTTLVEPREDLLEALLAADLLLCGAGQTMLEASAAGTPAVVAVLAENQRPNAETLERLGAVATVDPGDYDGLTKRLAELAADVGKREAMSRAGQEAVDGYGVLRVAFQIERLIRSA
jgi:UDP-2,4-diacetamido-2,4,6-trideoxy-beta-L-altropyranose hydrolase